jgi:hypothetical protein
VKAVEGGPDDITPPALQRGPEPVTKGRLADTVYSIHRDLRHPRSRESKEVFSYVVDDRHAEPHRCAPDLILSTKSFCD